MTDYIPRLDERTLELLRQAASVAKRIEETLGRFEHFSRNYAAVSWVAGYIQERIDRLPNLPILNEELELPEKPKPPSKINTRWRAHLEVPPFEPGLLEPLPFFEPIPDVDEYLRDSWIEEQALPVDYPWQRYELVLPPPPEFIPELFAPIDDFPVPYNDPDYWARFAEARDISVGGVEISIMPDFDRLVKANEACEAELAKRCKRGHKDPGKNSMTHKQYRAGITFIRQLYGASTEFIEDTDKVDFDVHLQAAVWDVYIGAQNETDEQVNTSWIVSRFIELFQNETDESWKIYNDAMMAQGTARKRI